MAVITYEDVTPSLVPNTTMKKLYRDGVHAQYRLTPVDGYVLHVKARDWTEPNPENMEEEILYRGYTAGNATCAASYDFTPVASSYVDRDGNIVPVTAYGAVSEFYAIPETNVPADQIFGGGNNDHEVM